MVIVFPPNDNVFNTQVRTQLLQDTWRELLRIPRNQNPVMDSNGSLAGSINPDSNRPFKLCFAESNTSVTRTIQRPSGSDIFIPCMSVSVTQNEAGPGEDLMEWVEKDQQSIQTVSLEVNGSQVQNLNSYRVFRGASAISHVSNNINGVPEGNHQTALGGIAVVMRLNDPPGSTVTIKSTGNLNCQGSKCVDENYDEDITYTINVV